MGYRWRNVISDCRKWPLQLTLKRQKWRLVFYLDCFGDKHIDFLLQVVFCSSTRMWLITFSVDEYHRIFFKNYFGDFYKFEGRGHNSLTVSSGEIRASLIQQFQIWNPPSNDLKQNIAKICNRNVSNNENRTDCCVIWSFWHSAYSTCTKTFTKFQRILKFSVCLF